MWTKSFFRKETENLRTLKFGIFFFFLFFDLKMSLVTTSEFCEIFENSFLPEHGRQLLM